jgi:hypothetical protein
MAVTACWAFDAEHHPDAGLAFERMRDEEAVVPCLWWFEVRNILHLPEAVSPPWISTCHCAIDTTFATSISGGRGQGPPDRKKLQAAFRTSTCRRFPRTANADSIWSSRE